MAAWCAGEGSEMDLQERGGQREKERTSAPCSRLGEVADRAPVLRGGGCARSGEVVGSAPVRCGRDEGPHDP
jgi:hypothetical protein